MAVFPSIYRAKVVRIGPTSIQAFVPQVFGDTPITVVNFLGSIPSQVGMGWVTFQAGNPDFPVWMSAAVGGEAPGPVPEGVDEVWISSTPPSDPDLELWYDPDAAAPVGPSGSYVHNQATPAATWVIIHNLGFYPGVRIENSAGDDVEGDVVHNSVNQITMTFSAAFAGKAYLS
jgi:hypothetical protein